jgi:hypothetical protein
MTIEELERRANVSISETPEILGLLLQHEHVRRVSLSGAAFALEYHSQFRVQSKEDILAVLKDMPKNHGVPLDAFREHSGATDAIDPMVQALLQDRAIYEISFKEGPSMKQILFLNRHGREKAQQEFVDLWNKIIPPSEDRDIEQALEQFGLKTLRNESDRLAAMRTQQQPSGRKRTRQTAQNRRLRITNVHMSDAGIDIAAMIREGTK